METFPGPNFFYMAKLRRPSLRRYLRAPALLITARRHHDSQRR